MANGDDFDVQTTGDISSSDPLIDWGSNLHPQDIIRYLHDPEGFKAMMVARGIPPPADVSAPMRDPSQGNLTDNISQAPLAFTEPDVPPQPPGVPPGTGGTSKGVGTAVQAVKDLIANPPNPNYGRSPVSPQPQPPGRASYISPGAGSLDPLSPRFVGPQPQGQTPEQVVASIPLPLSDPRKAKMEEDSTDTGAGGEDKTGKKGLSDLAKMMQGVKAPPRPQIPQAGTPHVPAHGSISPTAFSLLQLLGQPGGQIPSGLPQMLLRMLGGR